MAQLPYFPPLQSVEDFSPARCAALLKAAVGTRLDTLRMDIHSVRTWTMHAQVAARFKVGSSCGGCRGLCTSTLPHARYRSPPRQTRGRKKMNAHQPMPPIVTCIHV